MTDESYIFHQQVKERGKMKTGARHKKNGCKSKKCTFPSDYLSRKEKAKLSGPVSSIKMNQPYRDFKSFKNLPAGLQREYFVNLIDNYGARNADIADMLGVSKTTLYTLCASLNPPLVGKRGGKVGRKMDDRWRNFISNDIFEPEVATVRTTGCSSAILSNGEFIPTSGEEKVMEEKKVTNNYGIGRMKLDMNGDKQTIIGLLQAVLNDNSEYVFMIDICKAEGNES